jgi:serine/threonine-protein kinase SRPK3
MRSERASSPQRQPPTSGFEVLSDAYLLEEETFSWYSPDDFYHVQIGEVFKSKYQVLGKLGFGSVSTAWLCRDLLYVHPFNIILLIKVDPYQLEPMSMSH